jgi:hypothetical protein
MRVLLGLTLVVTLAACRDCETLGNTAAQASIEPAIFDFGPIAKGSTCTAVLEVVNSGRENLDVNEATLEDPVGSWTITKSPSLVELGGREELLIEYVADGDVGAREASNVKLVTSDPDNDGVVRATVTALVIEENGPVAKSRCLDANGADTSPCATLDFGAVQTNGPGRTLFVTVVNDGTADMTVDFAINGNAAYTVLNPIVPGTRDAQIGTGEERSFPLTIPPGRSSECGADSGEVNVAFVPVLFAPTTLDAALDTLSIGTNGLEADGVPDTGLLEIPLSGFGSDTGILMQPDTINFGSLPEGESDTIEVRVANIGTSSASVNISCIDLENDGECEARCTGSPDDTALNGSLSCDVTLTDGGNEGDGFVLDPTDARADGLDERLINVTWSPGPGSASIPQTAVLALHSNILGDRIFTAQLIGGNVGIVEPTVVSDDQCPGAEPFFCIETEGTTADTQTWTGEIVVRLTNSGSATVNIALVELDGEPTIVDDYTLQALSSSTLAANGGTADFQLNYANNDFSTVDPVNVIVTHDGAGGTTTIPIDVIPPP